MNTSEPPIAGESLPTSETIQVLEKHVSVRRFRSEPVSDAALWAVLLAGRRAPSSSNLQTYSIVAVRDPQTRAELGVLAGNQSHVADAPVVLAVCADLSRAARACELHGSVIVGDTLEMGIVAVVDATLAGMSVALAAESIGLGYVMIGGMRNRPLEIARLLHLPHRAFVVFGICLGWPADRPEQKPRLPEAAVIHFERYTEGQVDPLLKAYDATLSNHYESVGKAAEEAAWTQRVAEDFSRPRREHLRAALETLGFPLM